MRYKIFVVGLLATLAVVGCGGQTHSQDPSGSPSGSPSRGTTLDSGEQVMLRYFTSHIDDMEDIVRLADDICMNYTNSSVMLEQTERLDTMYGDMCDEYNATNGGKPAGGAVARIESLWEATGKNMQTVIASYRGMLAGDDVDVAESGKALGTAVVAVEVLREEIDRVQLGSY